MTREPALRLDHSGCLIRLGRGSQGRMALEVSADHVFYDVMVADSLGSSLLRGAIRGQRAGLGHWAVAWGSIPRGGGPVTVCFGPGRFKGDPERCVTARVVGGCFWIAEARGVFRRVTVTAPSARTSTRLVRG